MGNKISKVRKKRSKSHNIPNFSPSQSQSPPWEKNTNRTLPPEIMKHIMQYHTNDRQTLMNCALVNRFWCRQAIPLLWDRVLREEIELKDNHFAAIKVLCACLPAHQKGML